MFGLLCLSLLATSGFVRADDWSYTLRPGDELWSVAKQYCGSARLADRIAAYNNLPNPGAVRAGSRIRIPTDWLAFAPTGAKLIDLTGAVTYLRSTATNAPATSAVVGQTIDMGGTLVTTEGSALVEFADGSSLIVQPNSRVLFNKLTAFGPAGMVDTHLRFSYGSGTTVVKPQNRGDRFRIETPEGIAAVRGTEFRVGYTAVESIATTETLEGNVAFLPRQQTKEQPTQQANQQATEIPAGFGIAASPTGITKEALLPAPSITESQTYTNGSLFEWSPLPGAAAYTLVWAKVTAPDVTVRVTQHTRPQAQIELSPGKYIARLRGVSAAGIAGMDAIKPIQIFAAAPQLQPLVETLAGNNTLHWTDTPASNTDNYEVEVTSLATLESAIHATKERSLSIDLGPGTYQWRVRALQSAWSEPSRITVLPTAPQNVTYTTRQKNVTMAWDKVDDADGYLLVIRHADGTSTELTTTSTQALIELEKWGAHSISVASTHQALQSAATTTDLTVSRRPWWLIALTVLAFAL